MKRRFSQIEEAYFKVIALKVADLIRQGHKNIAYTKAERTLAPVTMPMQSVGQNEAARILKERLCLFNKIGIYIHLPFCSYRCAYCNYAAVVRPKIGFIDEYLNSLKREIVLIMELSGRRFLVADSIYFGGGTPAFLSQRQIKDILNFLFKVTDVSKDTEITFEASPETLTAAKIGVLLENKVNRLSIGFQSFENRLLKIMNRRHTVADSILSFNLARKCGFRNINIDLLYGIPGQSMRGWQHSLGEAIKLRPASIFTYRLFSPYGSKWCPTFFPEKTGYSADSTIKNLAFSALAIDKLTEAGYVQKSLYRFILPGEHPLDSRYFMDEVSEKLSFGVSSRSLIGDLMYLNHSSVARYMDSAAKRKIPVSKIRVLTLRDKIALSIISAAKRLSLNKEAFANQFGFSIEDIFGKSLSKLEGLSLITNTSSSINLSYKGILLLQEAWMQFLLKHIQLYLRNNKTPLSGKLAQHSYS